MATRSQSAPPELLLVPSVVFLSHAAQEASFLLRNPP